jgi:hypothetical protein
LYPAKFFLEQGAKINACCLHRLSHIFISIFNSQTGITCLCPLFFALKRKIGCKGNTFFGTVEKVNFFG